MTETIPEPQPEQKCLMPEAEFSNQVALAVKGLNLADKVGSMLSCATLERLRNYVRENNAENLEKLLPEGWKKKPHG